jgi:hypothetical protein
MIIRLQVQHEFGDDQLIEAYAFGFRFACQGGMERVVPRNEPQSFFLSPMGYDL